jgi:hypothetical protein
MAEYEGLLLALRKARAVGARRLVILTDSELVAGQIGKTYKAKKPDMMKYLQVVRSMEKFSLASQCEAFPGTTTRKPMPLRRQPLCLNLCPRMCSTRQQL